MKNPFEFKGSMTGTPKEEQKPPGKRVKEELAAQAGMTDEERENIRLGNVDELQSGPRATLTPEEQRAHEAREARAKQLKEPGR